MGLFNLVDFPAGCVPVGQVTSDDDHNLDSYPDANSFENPVYKLLRKAGAQSEGLPIGVQVAALPFREEICLRAMLEIETLMKTKWINFAIFDSDHI